MAHRSTHAKLSDVENILDQLIAFFSQLQQTQRLSTQIHRSQAPINPPRPPGRLLGLGEEGEHGEKIRPARVKSSKKRLRLPVCRTGSSWRCTLSRNLRSRDTQGNSWLSDVVSLPNEALDLSSLMKSLEARRKVRVGNEHEQSLTPQAGRARKRKSLSLHK